MNIIKLFILNMILLYFLKYDKKYVYMILCMIIIYFIMLNYNIIEGNTNNNRERKIKIMEMLELNNLMDTLIGVFKDSNKDCYGEYSEYSPCDKKCGAAQKISRYRIKQKAGLYGNDCIQIWFPYLFLYLIHIQFDCMTL